MLPYAELALTIHACHMFVYLVTPMRHMTVQQTELLSRKACPRGLYVRLARTVYIRCIYGIIGRETIDYTVIYGAYIRFWPTLLICCPLN